MKKTLFFLLFYCFIANAQGGGGWDFQQAIFGEQDYEGFGYDSKISNDGKTLVIGAPYYNSYKGYVVVYEKQKDGWAQKGQKIYGANVTGALGISVDISSDGSIIAFGSPLKNTGHVQVYKYDSLSSSWQQLGSDIVGTESRLGLTVSLSSDGTTLATNDSSPDRSAKVFHFNGNDWVQLGQTINNGLSGDYFGSSIELSDDAGTLVIGASQSDTKKGYAEVYKLENNLWVQKGNRLTGFIAGSLFGQATAINADGSRISIGAPNLSSNTNTTDKGHVYVYQYSSSNDSWEQIGQTFEGSRPGEYFGYRMDMTPDGSKLALGIYGANDWSGKVQIFDFKNETNSWTQLGGDIGGYTVSYQYFGISVSVNSDASTVAAGNIPEILSTGYVMVIERDSSLAVDENRSTSFAMYPNPVSDILTIRSDKKISNSEIYDLSGKLILSSGQNPINLRFLKKGNYLVKITFQDKTYKTTKIIKNQ